MSEDTIETLWQSTEALVLASRSPARRALLEAAGLPVEVVPADIDERYIEDEASSKNIDPNELALILARQKATTVSRTRPTRLVIGADQTMTMGSRLFHKPADRAEALKQLKLLRGHTHVLHSAVALVQDGIVLWSAADEARLAMRDVSDEFLDWYLEAAGDSVTQSVGAYRLEALGIHLFEKVDGDHTTVLGLPMLPLLDTLRREGAIAG